VGLFADSRLNYIPFRFNFQMRCSGSYQGAYFPDMLLTNAIIDSAIILNILVAAETAWCNIY